MAHLDSVYASVAVNASPQCLDVSPTSGLVAFGASNAVVLMRSRLTKVSDTLVGHVGRVNCVKWVRRDDDEDDDDDDEKRRIPTRNDEDELISASRDGTIKIWNRNPNFTTSTATSSFVCVQTLRGHEASVNVVDAVSYDDDVVVRTSGRRRRITLIASTGSDAAVKIWKRTRMVGNDDNDNRKNDKDDEDDDDNFRCIADSLPKSFSFAFALRWAIVPEIRTTPLLLVAGDDSNVHVYRAKPTCSSSSASSSSPSSYVLASTLRGHEDWVRSLDVAFIPSDQQQHQQQQRDLLIASASQDGIVRLWRFRVHGGEDSSSETAELNGVVDSEVRLKSRRFQVERSVETTKTTTKTTTMTTEVSIVLESVLIGHEGAVYSVCWRRRRNDAANGGGSGDSLLLLTASMDKTLILWKYDAEAGVWLDETRVGDVGGNTLGFYGALFGRYDGNDDVLGPQELILAHDFQGALHLWQKPSSKADEEVYSVWRPRYAVGGHFRSVEDLVWDPFAGGFGILSVSVDQTTRFHAPLTTTTTTTTTATKDNKKSSKKSLPWIELGRPQVHGYDMTCVTAVAPGFRFVSGADEKVLRVFEAPKQFFDAAESLSGTVAEDSLKRSVVGDGGGDGLVMGAAVPALGLSNKAIREGATNFDADDGRLIRSGEEISLNNNKGLVVYPKLDSFVATSPPLESDLLQNTLWPEAQKLYGHGNPIFCCASSVDGRILASASKAAKQDEASILLWGGAEKQWRHLGSVDDAHSLTVTQMAFGKTTITTTATGSGEYTPTYRLLSVSRDRTIVLTGISIVSANNDDNEDAIEARILFRTNKSNGVHARIIWTCDWSHDDAFFITGSRDKKLVAWQARGNVGGEGDAAFTTSFSPSTPANLPDACTAVSCAPRLFSSAPNFRYLAAVGLENGSIRLMVFDSASKTFSELLEIPLHLAHHLTVKRLRFRPTAGRAGGVQERDVDDGESCLQLASCGADGFVRVYHVDVETRL